MAKSSMEDVGLQWNPKKCAVAHVKRGVQVTGVSGGRVVEWTRIPCLDDGEQYKFLGVLESVMQEDKLVLGCAASPLSDYHRVVVSNQFALTVFGYLMWTQRWPVMELKEIDIIGKRARLLSRVGVDTHVVRLHCCICQQVKEGGGCALLKWSTKPRKRVRSDSTVMKTPHWEWYGSLKSKRRGRGIGPFFKEAAKCAEEFGLDLDLENMQKIKTEV